MRGTVTIKGIHYVFTRELADYKEFSDCNGDRILVDKWGHITHEEHPKADNIVSSWNSPLLADVMAWVSVFSDMIAWTDEKQWSQSK